MKRLTFFILCLEGAVLSFNVAATAALVPSVAKEFALSDFIAGKAIWIYMIPYGISALIYGPLVRRFDAKVIELVCMFFFSSANLVAGMANCIGMFFTGRFFMGVFGASVIPLGLILIARHVNTHQRGKLVGIFFSSTFIASLSGLFLSGVINWRLIYLIPGYLGFLIFILMYFCLPRFKEDAGYFKVQYLDAFKHKRILIIFTYIFFISLFYHGIQQWLGVYFSRSYAFGQFLISMLVTLTSLSGIFGEVIGGVFSDNLGRTKTVRLGLILMIISVAVLLLKLPVLVLSIIMITWGLGWTINHAALSTMLTDLPKQYLNEAASLNSSVRFISGGLGTALSSLLMQKSFILGFGVLGACLCILLLFSKPLGHEVTINTH